MDPDFGQMLTSLVRRIAVLARNPHSSTARQSPENLFRVLCVIVIISLVYVLHGRRFRGDEGDMSPQYLGRGDEVWIVPPPITGQSFVCH